MRCVICDFLLFSYCLLHKEKENKNKIWLVIEGVCHFRLRVHVINCICYRCNFEIELGFIDVWSLIVFCVILEVV